MPTVSRDPLLPRPALRVLDHPQYLHDHPPRRNTRARAVSTDGMVPGDHHRLADTFVFALGTGIHERLCIILSYLQACSYTPAYFRWRLGHGQDGK